MRQTNHHHPCSGIKARVTNGCLKKKKKKTFREEAVSSNDWIFL